MQTAHFLHALEVPVARANKFDDAKFRMNSKEFIGSGRPSADEFSIHAAESAPSLAHLMTATHR